jgi:hypothetical protein
MESPDGSEITGNKEMRPNPGSAEPGFGFGRFAAVLGLNGR